VLRKANGGKARALNAGLAVTSADVVVTLDADTILDPGAFAALRAAYVRDPTLTVACGVLTPVCIHGWSAGWFGLFQRMEYWRSFLWRMGWMRERTLVLVSGAFAAYRRSAITAIGGFDPASKAEDYELMFRLHRAAIDAGTTLAVAVVSDARAVTDAPGTPLRFLRQRRRWFAGFIETLIANRDLVGAARAGALGRSHLVVKTVDLLLPLYGLAALITLAMFLIAGGGVHPSVLAALGAKLIYDVVIHLWALSLYRRWQRRALGWWVVPLILVEPILFQPLRQLGALLGWVDHLKRRIDWTPQRPTGAPA
jgi:cellulose synthase/poly-beta-1,6-N-acetylglucosamine synthase-like glycosyltransferase